jgi:hypothetical protein
MAIALNMLGYDDDGRLSCQVGPMFPRLSLSSVLCLANCDPQGLGHY